MERGLLRVEDIAMELGCSRSWVYKLVARGVVPHVRVGGAIRCPAGAWARWLAGQDREALRALRAAQREAAPRRRVASGRRDV